MTPDDIQPPYGAIEDIAVRTAGTGNFPGPAVSHSRPC